MPVITCKAHLCRQGISEDSDTSGLDKHLAKIVEYFFAFIFQLSEWALVAPSCFALQVRDASPQETR